MLIKFNAEHALMVPVEDGTPMLRILPKINEIADEVWNRIRPHLSHKLDRQKGDKVAQIEELHVVAGKPGAKGVTGKTLKDLTPAEAEAIVKDTLDSELLKLWKTTEKRDDIRLAIANQVEEMSKRNKSKTKSDDQ